MEKYIKEYVYHSNTARQCLVDGNETIAYRHLKALENLEISYNNYLAYLAKWEIVGI